jgi:hypothetical protein
VPAGAAVAMLEGCLLFSLPLAEAVLTPGGGEWQQEVVTSKACWQNTMDRHCTALGDASLHD